MNPARRSRQQNNYFDKPPEMLRDWHSQLGEMILQTECLYEGLVAEQEAVAIAIEENAIPPTEN